MLKHYISSVDSIAIAHGIAGILLPLKGGVKISQNTYTVTQTCTSVANPNKS